MKEKDRESDTEGEGEYQLLLECRSNTRQKRRGRCVRVFVRVCAEVSGFYPLLKVGDVLRSVLATCSETQA